MRRTRPTLFALKTGRKNSLVVQWLGLWLPLLGPGVQSVVRELRCHKLQGVARKKKMEEEAMSPGVWVVSRKGTVTDSTLKLSERNAAVLKLWF